MKTVEALQGEQHRLSAKMQHAMDELRAALDPANREMRHGLGAGRAASGRAALIIPEREPSISSSRVRRLARADRSLGGTVNGTNGGSASPLLELGHDCWSALDECRPPGDSIHVLQASNEHDWMDALPASHSLNPGQADAFG